MNKQYISKLVLEELNNRKFRLDEAVSTWPTVKQLFASHGINSYVYDNIDTIAYSDFKLGDIKIMSDGTGYIEDTGKTANWKLIKNTKGEFVVNFDNHILNIERIKHSEYKPKSSDDPVIKYKTASKKITSDIDKLQTALDWLGFIPGYGDILDAINATMYFARGKYLDGALSLVAIIPVIGSGIKLGLKGTMDAAGGTVTAARIWKKAAKGNTTELVDFYKLAIQSGKLNKIQLRAIARKGDVVAQLLLKGKGALKNYAPGTSMDAVMKQIDELSALIRNTTSIPIKKSMLSKIGAAIKASKVASKTAGAGKLAFKLGANAVTFGGYGIAVNLVKKLGIGKREMTYLKDAMDFRFMKKITSNSTLTTAMFKSNKKLTARELASLGIPPWIYARPTKEMYNWFNTLQKTNPLKWKQISNTIGRQSADANNPYYAKFVENAFSQASNIFRPGTVLKAGYPEMFAKVFKLDSYRLSNPKNLDIVKNEIEDLAEKLGLDPQDDPQAVIMPSIFMVFNKFLIDAHEAIMGTAVGGAAISILGGEDSTSNAETSIPGGTVVDTTTENSIETEFKQAPGTTTEKLQTLVDKGFEDAEIYALKKVLDIE